MGVSAARPCTVTRLSLERRRNRRHLRSTPEDLFCPGALERARSDSQGAHLWTHRQRRQSWRGRKGVLLLSRQYTDTFVPEVPVQVSARSIPICGTYREQSAARKRRAGVRAVGYWDLR